MNFVSERASECRTCNNPICVNFKQQGKRSNVIYAHTQTHTIVFWIALPPRNAKHIGKKHTHGNRVCLCRKLLPYANSLLITHKHLNTYVISLHADRLGRSMPLRSLQHGFKPVHAMPLVPKDFQSVNLLFCF